ncbi:MAG: hypothetical protein IT181_02620 [Acidobacteria bacterium]|nr:hypothetical protein [Acidobacteriota bacterium]
MRSTTGRLIVAAALAAAGGLAQAQDFPEGSQPPPAAELKKLLADKVFDVKTSTGPPWRWEFKGNGYFFINIGNFSDTGPWTAEEGRLCTKGARISASCNDVRLAGGGLYLKRDNGQVVQLVPRP